jgi:hypothetical protein
VADNQSRWQMPALLAHSSLIFPACSSQPRATVPDDQVQCTAALSMVYEIDGEKIEGIFFNGRLLNEAFQAKQQ